MRFNDVFYYFDTREVGNLSVISFIFVKGRFLEKR